MKKEILGILAALIIGIGLTGIASAYQGDYNVKGPNYSEERHEAIEEAMETGDYESWLALMEETGRNSRVTQIVTEENFAEFVEAHNSEFASEIRSGIGLNDGEGPRDGTGFKQRQNSRRGIGQRTRAQDCEV